MATASARTASDGFSDQAAAKSSGETSGKPGKAKLGKDGDAKAPSDAPKLVRKAIEAANEINEKPYKYGGGHSEEMKSKGYDCSGAMSYVLRKIKQLKDPLDSSGFMKYGKKGKGDWITTYANPGHAYMTIAGLRFDTSGNSGGDRGPRWHEDKSTKDGYKIRHPKGL